MTEFTRTLIFRGENLGRNTTFMLTFNSDGIPGIYRDVFPTAWKIAPLPASGLFSFTATFKSSPGVSLAQLGGSGIIPPSTFTPIDFGQETSLQRENSYHFSTPINTGDKSVIKIKNETNSRENFGVGTFDHSPSYPPSTLWVYEGVGAGYTVQVAGFNHILGGYITSDYREGDILRGPVNSPVLFQEDITKLEEITHWKISYDPSSGIYRIQRE